MEITQSLFGATPESIQQARDAALNAQAAQYAEMDPFQRSAFSIYKGANQLGGAIGGMLGGQDSQMQLMKQRQTMMEGVDQNDPKSWLQLAAKANSMKDYTGAQEAVAKAQALNKAQQDSLKTTAEIGASNATAAEKTYNISATGLAEGLLKTGKYTPESVAGYVRGSKDPAFKQLVPIDHLTKPTSDFAAKAIQLGLPQFAQYGNYTAEQVGAVNTALLKDEIAKKVAGAPKTAINLGGNKYAEAVGGKLGEGDVVRYDNAQGIPAALSKVNETLGILKNSDINTGMGAELFTTLDRARTQFAADKKAGKRVSDTEYLNSLLGSEVFPLIQSLGIGARGMDTPAEREFLRAVMTGTITLNKDTLVRMASMRKNAMLGEAAQYNKKVESGELDRFFDVTGRTKTKIDLSKADIAPPVNPSTGAWGKSTVTK